MAEIDPSFWEEDEEDWEDTEALSSILKKLPEGWSLVKVMAPWNKLVEMREWLTENTIGKYREVNWANGGCSYSVGVMLEEEYDIVMFKIRWG